MKIEDEKLNEQMQNELCRASAKFIPMFCIFMGIFSVMYIVNLIQGTDHAMYFLTRNLIVLAFMIICYILSKRWVYVVVYCIIISFIWLAG